MRTSRSALMLLAACALPVPALASYKGWDDASSVGAYGLAAVALGLPLARHDTPGALQAAASLGAAEITTQGLKAIVHEERPDRSNNNSFPSGHTALAFAAAATLHNRGGWQEAVPAYLVASFVGVARVEARKHHWYDVVAGAAIGETSGLLLTHKRDAAVRLLPWGDAHGGGVALGTRF